MEHPTTETREPALGPRNRARSVAHWMSWGTLGSLLAAMAVQRWLFIFEQHRPRDFVFSDMLGYVTRAARLASPGTKLGQIDAFFPPGTHVLMTPLFRIFGTA